MFWRRRSSKGQTTAEYILIVVLVAVLSIGIITIFGNQIRALFGYSTKQMAGEDDATLNTSPADQADGAEIRSLRDTRASDD